MATFKSLTPSDIKVAKSQLNQLVDITAQDVSGSATREKYQMFVTGGIGPGVTSSLFQTVYDQDYSLQTANAVFDITFGIFSGSSTCADSSTGVDTDGKVLYASESLMMREKVGIYSQMAQLLKGNSESQFTSPLNGATTAAENIDHALFLNFKRLFARDSIKPGSFAMRFYSSASNNEDTDKPNLIRTSESGSTVLIDGTAAAVTQVTIAGKAGNIVKSSDTSQNVGVIYYEQGVAVLNLDLIISGTEHVSGSIAAVTTEIVDGAQGRVNIGTGYFGSPIAGTNQTAKFIPDLIVSASLDDIIDHVASCRVTSGTITSIAFQNITNINSSLIFCRATADEFNYSSNPTYINFGTNKIRVIEDATTQTAFSMPTGVGLYDNNGDLVAVAKFSRPIEKNNEKDLTVRIRLDF